MKFAHIADLHIGKRVHDFSMLEDQRYILDQMMKIFAEQKVDGVLIAGDGYDKTVPWAEAVQLCDEFITGLAKAEIPVYMISGNHDSAERLSFGAKLFESSDIYISQVYDGEMKRIVLKDQYGPISVYLLPFLKPAAVRHALQRDDINTYEEGVMAALQECEIDRTQRNVLVAHQFVTGADRSDSEETWVGGLDNVSAEVFKDFDYVALGHIHSSQSVGREEVRYAGSPLKYSLSEAGPVKQIPGGVRERDGAKQVPIVTVDGEGQVTIELEKLVPLRDLIHIRGTFTEIVKEENQIEHTEDFVYVTLTDEDIVPDAMRIMRQYYPNTIKLDYDNSRTRELSHVDVVQATQSRSYEELIGDFYKQMYGAQISEEEMDMMKDVAKEVGIYEAD